MTTNKLKLKDLNKNLTEAATKKREQFNLECNRNSDATYYNKIKLPWTCTQKEKEVLAKIFEVNINDIDWEKPKNFVA